MAPNLLLIKKGDAHAAPPLDVGNLELLATIVELRRPFLPKMLLGALLRRLEGSPLVVVVVPVLVGVQR